MATANKGLNTPANGSNVGTWDVPTNANFTAIDTAFGGNVTISVTSVTGPTLTLSGAQYAPPNIVFSGVLSANLTYNFPSGVGGVWSIYNNTTGAFTLTIGSAGGGISNVLPQGYRSQIVCDGANVAPTSNVPGGSSVSSFSGGATGLTPATATTGVVTLGGTLAVANGGTGAGTAGGAQTALNVPSATGAGASGTWGINVSGLAATSTLATTATTANTLNVTNSYTVSGLTVNGTLVLPGASNLAAAFITNAAEVVTVSATAATGTIAYYPASQSVLYYTTAASANWTVNVAFSSGTSLNAALGTGSSITVVFLVTQGTTAYYNNAFQVDGVAVVPKWQGGAAPIAGNASGIDSYSYTIIKTGSAAFTVLASLTQFK